MFTDFPEQARVVQVLQRSLERDRLGHAYLFAGNGLEELEAMARTLANGQVPVPAAAHGQRGGAGLLRPLPELPPH
jgi:hypothetical protein